MVPKDSGTALSFAGPHTESRSCSGTAIATGLGRGGGGGGRGGGGGGGTGTLPYTRTVSDWGATTRRWLTTAAASPPIVTRATARENPSGWNLSVAPPS